MSSGGVAVSRIFNGFLIESGMIRRERTKKWGWVRDDPLGLSGFSPGAD